jgi:protein SCO1
MTTRSPQPVAADQELPVAAALRFVSRVLVLLAAGAAVYLWLVRENPSYQASNAPIHAFAVSGIVRSVQPETRQVTISHETIPGYMTAMTMPFHARQTEALNSLNPGDTIRFRLSVTETESSIDQIVKLASAAPIHSESASPVEGHPAQAGHPLLSFAFTNELGQPVTLQSFHGQALAITFFFTRCPLPDFCPRLSRNFSEASQELSRLENGPTNWHFLSVSFDPEFDSPGVLQAYGRRYHYDPAHWSFLTGPKVQIGELARLSNVQVTPDQGLFNHNFRTMIVDANGRLQMVFPVGGDLSHDIVLEMLKAAGGTNKSS